MASAAAHHGRSDRLPRAAIPAAAAGNRAGDAVTRRTLIMLAAKLNEYGMISWFGKELGAHLQGYRLIVVYAVVAIVYFYSHYFFASATAHISALFPLSLALMIAAGIPPFVGATALGALSSVNGCLTQYAIGSGPVMFGAGYVTQGEWWRVGFIMSVIYLAIWLVIGPLWRLLLGHI